MVGRDGEIINFEKNSSRIFDKGDVIETLYLNISDYMKRYNAADSIKAVAIGLPSMVSKDKKTVISTPNLKGFDNIPFGDTLSKKLGIPVYVDRDVNFLLQNDIVTLGLPKDSTVLGFYIGTGFGNAIYLNGSFYCGRNGAAGELGHIPFPNIEEKCTCGNVGCSEVICSGKYLEKITAELFPETDIKNVTLLPFMLVCGDHAKNDMAVEWKEEFENNGFNVNCDLTGLGEIKEIQDMYAEHLRNVWGQ